MRAHCKAHREEIDRKEEETLRKARLRRLFGVKWMKQMYGFDIEIEGASCYFGGMSVYKGGVDCPLVARLYAKVGLHRYNMLEGTNLHLREIEKYNLVCIPMPVSYYITLLAEDPIDQTSLGQMDFSCYISRPKGIKSEIYPKQFFDAVDLPGKWPSKEAFADKTRFLYKMQESDWEEHDWIRLYTEIAFFNSDRWLNHNLSDLKILNVVVETEENLPHETVLKSFRNVLVYIRYDQYLGADGVCKHIAIVRRTVELTTHCVCLFGESLLVPDSE
ncbi:hypothetical protein Bca52824_076048 [Brassica carinata]|uniref:Uncharacterized protein n=1 Tax=Brassica carinata TaxID=52824 RepID=A0A8X7TWX6_BRACI|nr:hypothetical protein Bca52824_076048 [Brassica carinata]